MERIVGLKIPVRHATVRVRDGGTTFTIRVQDSRLFLTGTEEWWLQCWEGRGTVYTGIDSLRVRDGKNRSVLSLKMRHGVVVVEKGAR
jgi:hypothetical protein